MCVGNFIRLRWRKKVKMKDKLLKKSKAVCTDEFTLCILISLAMTLLLEILARHSVTAGFSFMVYHVRYFLTNYSIIFCTVTLCLFFKRRYFVLALTLLLWMALGVTNSVILTYRNTPLAAVDFSIVKSALDIMNAYIKPIQIINIVSSVVVAVVVSIVVLKFAPRVKPNIKKAIVCMGCAVIFCACALRASYSVYKNPECFANLPEAYRNYGFVYSFSCSTVNRGVDKPKDYSEQRVKQITDSIDDEVFPEPAVKPNIVYVQLESFFDVKNLKNVVYNEDPVPNFTALKDSCISGYFRIPGLGGGTCNAEFETLTGMSVGMFGTCEYPYKTITLKHTASSICYDLKNYGYSSHAVHDHTGTFYDRNLNYPNLGFDTFTPVEYMHDVERNPKNWAKDKILTGEIMKCLNSTEGRDFVFAVSVQGHGKYPTEVIDDTQTIKVLEGMENDEEYKIGFEYYINQLHEMDEFIGQLVETLKSYKEPTVLVMYGDHLPAMSIDKEQLVNSDLFQTQYFIWSNYNMNVSPEEEHEDITAYQLSSKLTRLLGFNCGYINRLHRYYKDNPDYRDALQMLMYDELYGENYAYGGEDVFVPTQMTFGIDPIYITSASSGETSSCIKGSGFTEKSKVYVNGTQVSATYVDTYTLLLSKDVLKPDDVVYVAQVCSDKFELGRTEEYTVTVRDTIQ